MDEKGTFPEGMIVNGAVCKTFSLAEENFGHTLGMINNPDIDVVRLDDPKYNSAALFAQRLTVEGAPVITPDMVIGLSGPDGRALINASVTLEMRRLHFRKEVAGAQKNDAGPLENGAGPGVSAEHVGG